MPLLTNMVNKSYQIGKFPDALKVARLVPLFKSGDHNVPENYRPISIMPSISKIFERLLYDTTEKFLKKIQYNT